MSSDFVDKPSVDVITKSRLFDSDWYRERYLQDDDLGVDPLQHYIKYGASTGNFPNPLFDTGWYAKYYKEIIMPDINPLAHFATDGAIKMLDPNPYFETKSYLEAHPDVAAHPDISSGVLHPLVHYLEWGWKERREIGSSFNIEEYLNEHPEIQGNQDPLAYFLHQGLKFGHAAPRKMKEKIYLLSGDPTQLKGHIIHSSCYTSNYARPPVEGISSASAISTNYGPVFVSQFPNIVVESGSDNLRNSDSCYLSKARFPLAKSMMFLDRGTVEKTESTVVIRETSTRCITVKSAFSLLGLHDSHWAHFIVQYFPKLRYLSTCVDQDTELSVLAPSALDNQSRLMLSKLLAENGIEDRLIYVDHNTKVICENLYYVDNCSWLADTQIGPGYTCVIIPDEVRHYLKKFFNTMVALPPTGIIDRIYLRRAAFRTTVNLCEIDEIFDSYGFKIVSPESLSLEDKVALFSGCKIVAGQFSSGFTNLIMCKPGTDAIIMSNTYRLEDSYIPTFAQESGVNVTMIAGNDIDPNKPDTDYHIDPLLLRKVLERFISGSTQEHG